MPYRPKKRAEKIKQIVMVVVVSIIAISMILAFMPGLFSGGPSSAPL